jgi:hypothetical protein
MKKLLLALLFIPLISFSQDIPGEGLIVAEFNAPFSNSKCEYLNELTDCDIVKIDISKKSNSKLQSTHKIASLPTLIIFYDGEEKGRFQANIMMQLEATKEEVQDKIDEILMEDF